MKSEGPGKVESKLKIEVKPTEVEDNVKPPRSPSPTGRKKADLKLEKTSNEK